MKNMLGKVRSNLFLVGSVFIATVAGIIVSPYVLAKTSVNGQAVINTTSAAITPGLNTNTAEANTVVQVTQNALPSVVTIQATAPMMQRIFSGAPNQQAIGSGFIVSSNGLIVTSKHVIADTTLNYSVVTANNNTYPVQKIFTDPNNDVAVLQINALNLKPVVLGNSSNLVAGQTVIAIGTQLGEFTNSVTSGIISGLNRTITAGSANQGDVEQLKNMIQIDAPINPGNSGGPLLDLSGQVVAINTAIESQAQNIGFAIPINVVSSFLATIH